MSRLDFIEIDFDGAPPRLRRMAEPTPRQCFGCGVWHSQGGQVLGFVPHERRTRVWFYRLCGHCAVLVRKGLGERILAGIEAFLLPLTWAQIEDLPDGGQLVVPPYGGGR